MRGSQSPSVEFVPESDSSSWQDVSDLCAAYGLVLDPWQERVLQGALGESGGRWSASRVGLSVPRQSGKTAILEARSLASLLLFGEELTIHSAHMVPTALEAFNRIRGYFENFDDLGRKVRQIRTANGEQGIFMKNGQRLLFRARSKQSLRGFSADCLLFDEAQVLNDETWAAVLPTTSARPNPQLWLTGTPPLDDGDGEVFTRNRKAALDASDKSLCWMEWSAEHGDDLDDPAVWAKANPGLGIRIREDAIASERASMSDDTFQRERLGIWNRVENQGVIPVESWQACRIGEGEPAAEFDDEAGVVFAVDMPYDRSRATVAIAGEAMGMGLSMVEVVSPNVAGTAELVDWLVERFGKWGPLSLLVDGSSPAGTLVLPLEDRGVPVTQMNTREFISACGLFQDAVAGRQLVHNGQPGMQVSLEGATRKWINDVWLWQRRNDRVDVSPVIAATLAHYGWATRSSREPKKKRSGKVW